MNILCIDIETTGLEQWSKELCINGAWLETPEDIIQFQSVKHLVEFIIKSHTSVSMHNGYSFDLPWLIYKERTQYKTDHLYNYLCDTPNSVIDTLLISRLTFPHLMKHSLAEWVERLKPTYRYLKTKVKIEADEWNQDNIEKITDRNHKDVMAQCAITQHFIDMQCMDEQAVIDYHGANKFVLDLSLNGLPFDADEALDVYARRILTTNREMLKVYEVLGRINIGSNAQIDKALKNVYGHGLPLGPPSKKTQKRSPLFNKKNARFVTKDFPILDHVLNYREAMNLAKFVEPVVSKKSYVNRYRDGRIYPSVGIIEARTLRASYQSPPVQQFPDDMKNLVKGNVLDMDFSGLEMQVLGYELKETFGETTIWGMNQRGDCPKQATVDCLGSLLDMIPEDKRLNVAKTVNYAVLFGQQSKNTLNVLQLDRGYESELKRALDTRFPALSLLTNKLKSEMRNDCILNLFGQRVQSPEYCIVNTFTQSSGALYGMKLLPLVYNHLAKHYNLIGFIHDEILLEESSPMKAEEIDKAIALGYQDFERIHNFPVISKLNWSKGKSWGAAH